jgi:hypothetical protein
MVEPRFAAEALGRFGEACFRAVGMPDDHASGHGQSAGPNCAASTRTASPASICSERIRRGVVNQARA